MVIWNPSEIAFTLGPVAVRWYALCWCIGLLLGYIVVYKLYRQQQIPQEKFDPLFLYCFVGILLGARLGHCLLYEPGYFLSHPLEMVLPMRQLPDGSWKYTGYAGLASHGGTLGLMIALWLYVRKTKVNLMRVLDNIAVATPVCACFIRLGNLMNSEIVGKYTGNDTGFVFAALRDPVTHLNETLPRYPAQLFEAIAYIVIFFVGLVLYRKYKAKVGTGFFFGYCLTTIFVFRFVVEFLKEVQEPWEVTMQQAIGMDQGQLLSIPFVVLGIYCMCGGKWCRRLGEAKAE